MSAVRFGHRPACAISLGFNACTCAVANATETWADRCESDGGFAISGTRMKEHRRESEGIKWCFHCRTRHEFWFVVMVPDGMSYYGPHAEIHGVKDDCTDLFPGWSRTWDED